MTTAELEILINVADRDLKEAIRTLRTLTKTAEQMGAATASSSAAASRNLDRLSRSAARTSATMGVLDKRVRGFASSARGHLAGLATMLGQTAGTGIIASVAVAGLKFDDLKQRAVIAFTAMLHSASAARKMTADLITFARNTPFTVKGVVSTAQQLMAMGVQARQVIPLMTAIGDAVTALGGDQDVLERVVLAMGQIASKGTVQAEEMRQLAQAGIPAWQMLAKAMGVTIPQAMKAVQKRSVTAAFGIAALGKGMEETFHGHMEKVSHTFTGLTNKMKNVFQVGSGAFMEPFFKAAIDGMEKINTDFSKPGGLEHLRQDGQRAFDVLSKLAGVVKYGFRESKATFGDLASSLRDVRDAGRQALGVLKQIPGAQHAADHAQGGGGLLSGNLVTGLIAGVLGKKVLGKLKDLATQAEEAGGKTALLRSRLMGLARLGAITVAIDLIISKHDRNSLLNQTTDDLEKLRKGFIHAQQHSSFVKSLAHGEAWVANLIPGVNVDPNSLLKPLEDVPYTRSGAASAAKVAQLAGFGTSALSKLTGGMKSNTSATKENMDALAFWTREAAKQRSAMKVNASDLKTAQDALKDYTSTADAAFDRLAGKIDQAFDAQTQKGLDNLLVRVRVVGKGIKEMFTMKPGDKTPAERELDALDKIEAKRNFQRSIFDARDALATAREIGDPRMIRDAQRDLEDGLTEKKRYFLQQRADVERKAADKAIDKAKTEYQAQRDLLKEHLDDSLALIKDSLDKGLISGERARQRVMALMGEYHIDLGKAGVDLGKAFAKGLTQSLDKVVKLGDRVYSTFKKIASLKKEIDKESKAASAAASNVGGATAGGSGVQPAKKGVPDVGIGANTVMPKVTEALLHPKLAKIIKAHREKIGTPADNVALAKRLAARYGWKGKDVAALVNLGYGESGWVTDRINTKSGAFGIGQALGKALPADYRGNPAAQIVWMLDYIKGRYGSPSKAWETWLSRKPHWYAHGGLVPGTGSTDSVPAMLTPGELVTTKRGTKDLLELLRSLRKLIAAGAYARAIATASGSRHIPQPVGIESLVMHTVSRSARHKLGLNGTKSLEQQLAQAQAHPVRYGLLSTTPTGTTLGGKVNPLHPWLGKSAFGGGNGITINVYDHSGNPRETAKQTRREFQQLASRQAARRRG